MISMRHVASLAIAVCVVFVYQPSLRSLVAAIVVGFVVLGVAHPRVSSAHPTHRMEIRPAQPMAEPTGIALDTRPAVSPRADPRDTNPNPGLGVSNIQRQFHPAAPEPPRPPPAEPLRPTPETQAPLYTFRKTPPTGRGRKRYTRARDGRPPTKIRRLPTPTVPLQTRRKRRPMRAPIPCLAPRSLTPPTVHLDEDMQEVHPKKYTRRLFPNQYPTTLTRQKVSSIYTLADSDRETPHI